MLGFFAHSIPWKPEGKISHLSGPKSWSQMGRSVPYGDKVEEVGGSPNNVPNLPCHGWHALHLPSPSSCRSMRRRTEWEDRQRNALEQVIKNGKQVLLSFSRNNPPHTHTYTHYIHAHTVTHTFERELYNTSAVPFPKPKWDQSCKYRSSWWESRDFNRQREKRPILTEAQNPGPGMARSFLPARRAAQDANTKCFLSGASNSPHAPSSPQHTQS